MRHMCELSESPRQCARSIIRDIVRSTPGKAAVLSNKRSAHLPRLDRQEHRRTFNELANGAEVRAWAALRLRLNLQTRESGAVLPTQ